MIYVSARTFKKEVRRDKSAARDMLVRKLFVTQAEDVPDLDVIRFAITTAAVDREDDTISLDGWDTTNFERNPVVLWGHRSDEPPIGRSIRLFRDDDALKSEVRFVPRDVPVFGERAEGIKQLCKLGFLSATSVGFRPLEWKVTSDEERGAKDDWCPGIDFIKQELMEFSIVSIPCNPEALIDPAAAAAVDIGAAEMAAAAAHLAAASAETLRLTAATAVTELAKRNRRQQGRIIAFA